MSTSGSKDDKRMIEFNEDVHDKIDELYDNSHSTVIFSSIEQVRLKESLEKAINFIDNPEPHEGIDVGCGTGNLTNHMLSLELEVTAADISEKFIETVQSRYGEKGLLKTLKINGSDLSNIDDNSFDIVAAYSVLHHIPDYMKIVKEMGRICKKSGVVYIDHEANKFRWDPNSTYSKLKRKIAGGKGGKFFKISNYINKAKSILKNALFKKLPRTNPLHPRYQAEGDIHVYKDDHIEWDEIIEELTGSGFEIVIDEDYLVYNERYGANLYNEYKGKCSDMKLLVAKKH